MGLEVVSYMRQNHFQFFLVWDSCERDIFSFPPKFTKMQLESWIQVPLASWNR